MIWCHCRYRAIGCKLFKWWLVDCRSSMKLFQHIIIIIIIISPRPPSWIEHFGALISRARGSHHVIINYRKRHVTCDMCEKYKIQIQAQAPTLRRDGDGIIGLEAGTTRISKYSARSGDFGDIQVNAKIRNSSSFTKIRWRKRKKGTRTRTRRGKKSPVFSQNPSRSWNFWELRGHS